MSQLREGRLGRLSSHDGGIPVYCRTVFTPDCGGFGVGKTLSPPVELIAGDDADGDEGSFQGGRDVEDSDVSRALDATAYIRDRAGECRGWWVGAYGTKHDHTGSPPPLLTSSAY